MRADAAATVTRSAALADACTRALPLVLGAALFLLPVVFATTTHDQFELVKQAILACLLLLGTALWATAAAARGSVEVRHYPLDLPVAIWAVVLIAATVTSVAPQIGRAHV